MLLGVWNTIWDKFREIVSKDIEYITTEEADLWAKKESLIQKIYALRIARDNWKQTEDGKKMKSSKAKSSKLRKTLKDLRKLNNITGINATLSGSAVTYLLLELDSLIEEDVHVADDDGEQDEMIEIETENAEVQAKIS